MIQGKKELYFGKFTSSTWRSQGMLQHEEADTDQRRAEESREAACLIIAKF
jgi:hypothetical protein